MRTLTLVLLMALCAPAVSVRTAGAQEQPPAFAELQRLDRALAKICETRPDRLGDREQELWKRRRELLESLDERQRAALKRASPLDEACLQYIARLAEPRRPTVGHARFGSQSGYAHAQRRYYRRNDRESPQARMAPQAPPAETAAPSPPEPQVDRRPSSNTRIAPGPSAPDGAPEPIEAAPARPLKDLFPWPPPTPSAQRALSPDVTPDSPPAETVGEVSRRLERVLREARFDSFGYYRVPGGFALVTRIENLDGTTGEPFDGAARWATRQVYAGLSLSSIFAITRSAGYYRVFAFVLTNDPKEPQPLDPEKTLHVAQTWANEGSPSLPGDVKKLPVGPDHVLVVMLYEFEKVEGGETNHFQPSRWPLDQHLSSLGAELKPPR